MVDRYVVQARIAKIREYVALLRKIRRIADEPSFVKDPLIYGNAERYLQLATQAVLNVSNHVVADMRLHLPADNKELFQLLATRKVLSTSLSKKLIATAGFRNAGQPIPRDHTADGRNLSPPLTWRDLPAGTKSLAVICEDPDAGNPPPFAHWVIYNIPPTAKGLPEGLPIDPAAPMPAEIAVAIQGISGFRRPIYRGPAPPPGKVHHYYFVVYAIGADLDLKPGLNRAELLKAIDGHVIGKGELVATYERKAAQ